MAKIEAKYPNIAICSTLHDPEGVFPEDLLRVGPLITSLYSGWAINVTTGEFGTHPDTKEAIHQLEKFGVVYSEATEELVPNKIERDHVTALNAGAKVAQERGAGLVMYADGDRLDVAFLFAYSASEKMAEIASSYSSTQPFALNVRRGIEDYGTHPLALVKTEKTFNDEYSRTLGMQLDMGSTTTVTTVRTAQRIVKASRDYDPVSYAQPKWYLIAQIEAGAKLVSVEAPEGTLTFETPRQALKKIPDLTGNETYAEIQEKYRQTLGRIVDLSPKEWKGRSNTVREYLGVLRSNSNRLGLATEQVETTNTLIDQALDYNNERLDLVLGLIAISGN